MIKSTLSYLSFDVVTQINIIRVPSVEFPTVTICNKSPFKTYGPDFFLSSQFQEIENSSSFYFQAYDISTTLFLLQYLSKALLYNESISDEQRVKLGFTLEEMMISCRYNNILCSSADFEFFYTYQFGNCYRFNSGKNSTNDDVKLKKATNPGSKDALRLELFVGYPQPSMDFVNTNGIILLVQNSSVYPLPQIECKFFLHILLS
jgi:hypothetical protein